MKQWGHSLLLKSSAESLSRLAENRYNWCCMRFGKVCWSEFQVVQLKVNSFSNGNKPCFFIFSISSTAACNLVSLMRTDVCFRWSHWGHFTAPNASDSFPLSLAKSSQKQLAHKADVWRDTTLERSQWSVTPSCPIGGKYRDMLQSFSSQTLA